MFGEKEIVGHTFIRIKNNKIVLPDFTGIEPQEELEATIDPYQRKILIMKQSEFDARLKLLASKIEDAIKEGRLTRQKSHTLELYLWAILPLHSRTITKKKEFTLFSNKPEDALELQQIRKLNFKDQVFAVGVGTHLEIYPSQEAYEEDIKEQTLKLEKNLK